jgi:TonB family protein
VSGKRGGALVVMVAMLAGVGGIGLKAQDTDAELSRRAKSKVQPPYPELARKMNLTGNVKVQVVVAPNGTVKDAKVVGGHPLLANAALDAVKKWRFEPASSDTTGVVDFKFEPNH